MAYAFIQDDVVVGAPAPSLQVVFGSAVTAGSLLVVTNASGGLTITGITDTQSNTWQLAKRHGPSHAVEIWYAMNAVAGATTITVTFDAGTEAQINAAEFSGGATTSALDLTNGNSVVSNTTHAVSVLTGPVANSLVIIVAKKVNGFTVTADPSGYTPLTAPNALFAAWYKIKTDASNESPSYTTQFAEDTFNAIASFKPAAGGGGGASTTDGKIIFAAV